VSKNPERTSVADHNQAAAPRTTRNTTTAHHNPRQSRATRTPQNTINTLTTITTLNNHGPSQPAPVLVQHAHYHIKTPSTPQNP
jgi:hypothetical protein